jgi:hypothetical protein
MIMDERTYSFISTYDGLVGFGLDRATDEASLMVYLQQLADDRALDVLVKRLTDDEINELFELISRLLKNHFNSDEYHELFLREPHEH